MKPGSKKKRKKEEIEEVKLEEELLRKDRYTFLREYKAIKQRVGAQ
jgi:hypothetical protein